MSSNKKQYDYLVHDGPRRIGDGASSSSTKIGLDDPLRACGCACATLRVVHVATCLFHVGGVILATVFLAMGEDWSIPVVASFADWRRRDPTVDGCRDGNCFVAPAHGTLGPGKISLQGLVVAFHVLSFAWQFAVLIDDACGGSAGIRDAYLRELSRGRNGFRWCEYALSAPLMTIIIAVVFGIVDFYALLALAACTSALQFFGYVQEIFLFLRGKLRDRFLVVSPIVAGFVFWAAYWSVIVVAFTQSIETSRATPSQTMTDIIRAIFWGMTIMYACFAVVLAVDVSRRAYDKPTDYATVEGAYCVLSLVSKWTLGALLAWLVRARATVIGLGFVVDPPCAIAGEGDFTTNLTNTTKA